MNLSNAFFEAAYGTDSQLPPSDLPEICFSGRSNVGKSSMINKVLNRKSIARVSSTPGKTVTVNFYNIGDFRLVDLPGYGYAKVELSEKKRFARLMEGYFDGSRNIRLVLQLMDMRIGPTEYDISMLNFLNSQNIPFAAVLTKCDKLNKTNFNINLNNFKEDLGKISENIPIIPFSSLKGIGVTDVLDKINESLNL